MPTTRKRVIRTAKPEGLTADQREFLLYGRNLLTVDYPFRGEKHRRRLWELHREELLEAVGPDRRPASWWKFEAPERRQIISGDPDRALWRMGESFGKCRVYNIENDWNEPERPRFESQKSYLERLNLLEEKS